MSEQFGTPFNAPDQPESQIYDLGTSRRSRRNAEAETNQTQPPLTTAEVFETQQQNASWVTEAELGAESLPPLTPPMPAWLERPQHQPVQTDIPQTDTPQPVTPRPENPQPAPAQAAPAQAAPAQAVPAQPIPVVAVPIPSGSRPAVHVHAESVPTTPAPTTPVQTKPVQAPTVPTTPKQTAPTRVASITELLSAAQAARASDVHLTEGLPPQMRVDGSLTLIPGGEACTTSEWFRAALSVLMTKRQLDQLQTSDELDFSVEVQGIARFRVNVFRQLGKLAAAMRFIPETTKPLEDLGVPRIAADLVTRPRGLVLVTGPTGSGKSTTLAAMIDLVNRKLPTHIVTMEDPVEFRHTSRTALIHQREIGSDTASFAEAMRRVLRQDPDIILIGELRDPESIASALTAAETGHLVLSTLHTQSAAKSINRIVDAFPPAQQAQVRTQLGDALQGIITQTLLPKATGGGRVIATEVLVNTPAIANLIREGEASQVYSMMQAGGELGMHTLDQDLKRLVERGEISLELAQSRAQDPKSIVEGVRVRSGLSEDTWMQDMGMQDGTGGWTQ